MSEANVISAVIGALSVLLAVLLCKYLDGRAKATFHERRRKERVEASIGRIDDYSGGDLTQEEARAIDPDRPPKWMTYHPRSVDREAPRCTCHGRAIKAGERVLWWPIPEHPEGAYDLFCTQTVDEARG